MRMSREEYFDHEIVFGKEATVVRQMELIEQEKREEIQQKEMKKKMKRENRTKMRQSKLF